MYGRKKTRVIDIGGVKIGGDNPIAIQSMCNTDTRDAASTIKQINSLEAAGCEIARVAVPDEEAAEALKEIIRKINIPLVADIHFDYRLALAAIDAGVDKLRINPGNIGSEDRVKAVVHKDRGQLRLSRKIHTRKVRKSHLRGACRKCPQTYGYT